MKQFPYLGQHTSVIFLRIVVAVIFMAHALTRLYNNSIEQFAEYLNTKGLVYGNALVWLLTVFEIAGSLLLAAGFFRRILSLVFIGILVLGIILIHAAEGWFVGEHGTGGMEYSVLMIAALIVIAATPHHHGKHRHQSNKAS